MGGTVRHRAADVERIRDELKCLSCGYALRGQSGALVRCPECGRQHNVANLVMNQWCGHWYHAPGFNLLAMPLLAPIGWCALIGIAGVLFQNQTDWFETIFIVSTFLAALVWIWLIVVVVRKYQRRIGLLLTFMIQLIFPLYFVGLSAIAGLVFSGDDSLLALLIIGGAASGAFFLAWYVQRLVARLCIRVHIRKLSDEGTIAA